MIKVSLLDCTLRDGAYITDGNFGNNTIKGIIFNLYKANIEMIEVGWLKDVDYKEGSTYYSKPNDIVQYLPKDRIKPVNFIAMVDYGRFDLEKLPFCDNSSINTIRLVFPKEKFIEAIEYSKIIKDKGYKLCLQAANTQSYSEEELIELAKKVNTVMPYSLSIVDTFGVMYFDDLDRVYKILDKYLDKRIRPGFHSHNNLQLSFALSMHFIKLGINSNRDIIVDSSLCGMGRGAGNTNTELITNYINCKLDFAVKYDTNIIMDTIDVYLRSLIQKYSWGYSIPFCIAGQLGSHVNNIAYLQNTHKTNFKDMKNILELIPKQKRKLYDYDRLEEAYISYMDKKIQDDEILAFLKNEFKNREILLVAPGKSTISHKSEIKKFILEKNPITINVNSISTGFEFDYLFFSNLVRFNYAKDQYNGKFKMAKKIITSNIKTGKSENEYIINYNSIMKRGWKYFENSMIMLLRLLAKLEVKKVNLAGFDGYIENSETYNDTVLQSDITNEEKEELNENIKDMLVDFLKEYGIFCKINFITPSIYSEIAVKTLSNLNKNETCLYNKLFS